MRMMRLLFLAGALVAASGCSHALHLREGQPSAPADVVLQHEELVEHRLILVGDAGKIAGSEVVMPYVLERADDRSTVVFLGDNVYDYGEWEAILDEQLAVVGRAADVLFVPGNHDWDRGFDAIRRQQEYVEANGARYAPDAGCAGPTTLDVPGARLIVVDSQFFLLGDRERPSLQCWDGADAHFDALAEALAAPTDDLRIMIAHHPLTTYGKHGGHFPWQQHLQPPVIGSLIILARTTGLIGQDLSGGAYGDWADRMRALLADSPPALFAAGHEHSLQVLAGGAMRASDHEADELPAYPEVVSGAGSKHGWVGHGDRTLYSEDTLGYAVLTILTDGRAALEMYRVDEGEERAWVGWITEE